MSIDPSFLLVLICRTPQVDLNFHTAYASHAAFYDVVLEVDSLIEALRTEQPKFPFAASTSLIHGLAAWTRDAFTAARKSAFFIPFQSIFY